MDEAVSTGLTDLGAEFSQRLAGIRQADESINWYPYNSIANLWHLDTLLPDGLKDVVCQGNAGLRVLDIGAADGDLGYFFDWLILDLKPSHQLQRLQGPEGHGYSPGQPFAPVRAGHRSLDHAGRPVRPGDRARAALSPAQSHALMMELALHARAMVLSTRVASEWPGGVDVAGQSGAYVYRCREANDDPTNYWCFTPTGLETALRRCGWIVKKQALHGAGADANPVDNDKDQRCFVYCERLPNWADLGKHHDF